MNRGKLIKHLPNLMTLINMSLGLTATLILLQTEHPHKVIIVTTLVLLGGIADFLDGYLARKLNAVTNLGKQLDSFADLVTFGIAPVLLLNYLYSYDHYLIIIIASLIYIMAGAYRLARYNLNNFSSHFVGLPITAAGILLVLFVVIYLYHFNGHSPIVCTLITALVMIILSLLMLSNKRVNRLSAANAGDS